jgi:uncharacterized protein YbjT (DUF2867 family)
MNASTIVVAGATGDLGGRIAKALLERGVSVKGLVRRGTARDKLERLQDLGVTIASVDLSSASQVTPACSGASCVVSALRSRLTSHVSFRPITRSISPSFHPERIAISICAETSTSASIRPRFQRPRSSTVR